VRDPLLVPLLVLVVMLLLELVLVLLLVDGDHWITIQDCLFVCFPDLFDGFVGFVAILKLNRLN
jgi:hypothetical protein